jgi:hypothetical protein
VLVEVSVVDQRHNAMKGVLAEVCPSPKWPRV